MDWRLCREMNAIRMGEFLAQVSQAHPSDFIVMVVDGVSAHKGKELIVTENIGLLPLPPYAPALNHPGTCLGRSAWRMSFRTESSIIWIPCASRLQQRLPQLANDSQRLRSLKARPWIVSLNLNAH